MKNLQTYEEFLNESVNEGATPRLLKSAGQNLARQVKGIKNYTEEQLKDRLLSTPVARMLSDDEILTVLDHAKKELGMNESRDDRGATEFLNESSINRFQPTVLDRTNELDLRIFKKLMPRTEKTSEEAMERIWSFEGNTMFAHYQYHIVKPNGNKPDRPTYRLHDSQYWLNDTQMKMQGRDPKERVNVTLVTVYDITDPMKEQNLGKIYVDTDAYLDELKKVFELIKQQS